MTKLYRSLCIFLFSLAIFSCSDDDPLPAPMVGFAIDSEPVEVGIPVMFDNLSTNAANYEWDFGDGQVVTTISPEVTFGEAGNVTVTLRAYTEDNQVDSTSQTFRVHERVLTGYILNVFPGFNGPEPWDPDEAGEEQWPDIAVIFTPTDANPSEPENGFLDGQFANIPDFARPIFRDIGDVSVLYDDPIIMGDEDWTFFLLDVDPDDVETIMGVEFNPVQSTTIKTDDGMAGEIQVVLIDDTSVLDVDFFFELQ